VTINDVWRRLYKPPSMIAVALPDKQLRGNGKCCTGPVLRGIYLEHIAADLRHRCDRDGTVGDGDVHRAAITARAAVMPE
jgi:hypothetical protein